MAVSIMLTITACNIRGNSDNTLHPDSAENSTSSGIGSVDTTPSSTDDPPPREGMVHSRLTNEWIEQQTAAVRPIAVMIPNEKNALPQYSLSSASILYEANVEGQMTRLMAIYEDWQSLEKIGNIRSLRSYYAYWAFEWDAIMIHVGGPFFINELLAQPDTNHVDETNSPDRRAFYRDADRPLPHNAYTTGPMILSMIHRKEYSLEYRELAEPNH